MEDHVIVVPTVGKGREIPTGLGHGFQLNLSSGIDGRENTPSVRDHCKALTLWGPEHVSRV